MSIAFVQYYRLMDLSEKQATDFVMIFEHLLRRISLTVNQSSWRSTLIDMLINRHIKFNIINT